MVFGFDNSLSTKRTPFHTVSCNIAAEHHEDKNMPHPVCFMVKLWGPRSKNRLGKVGWMKDTKK